MTGAVSYLICGTPRTGSTLLCTAVADTGVLGRPESYFRRPDERAWAERWRLAPDMDGSIDFRAYLTAAVRAGSTANRTFGLRVMWGTLDDVVERLEALWPALAGSDTELLERAFGSVRYLFLSRRNVVAQAVSWSRAEQTGHWQDNDRLHGSPRYDFTQIHSIVATVDEHNRAWRAWFERHAVQPFTVTYEDLVANLDATVRSVAAHLGVSIPAGHRRVARHHQQADQLNAAWSRRYLADRGRSST